MADKFGRILASSQVAATGNVTIYSAPTSSAVKIATAVMSNGSTADVQVSVSVIPSGGTIDGTHKIVPSFWLAAGDTTEIVEVKGAMLESGASIVFNCSAANAINYLLTGVSS